MQLSIVYENAVIPVTVEYSRRKTLGIRVEPPDKVTVRAPYGANKELIQEKVQRKAAWIVRTIQAYHNLPVKKASKEFVNGEIFLYMGREYQLQVEIDPTRKRTAVKLYPGEISVITPGWDRAVIREAVENWYRREALEAVRERVEFYQLLIGKTPRRVAIREQKTRWGSCSSQGNLNFNWKIVMAPAQVINYIVVHEMCHLLYLNHSREYWNLVAGIMPDYKEMKDWLKKNGYQLNI